jgi:hypothetical protein
MTGSRGTLLRRIRTAALTFAVAGAGAGLGIVLAPSSGRADDGSYSCISLYMCSLGSHECCADGDGGQSICSTLCPIIIH